MLRIQVECFSCIAKADLALGNITVLIGPQASGKSVLSKLSYFFIETISDQFNQISEDLPFNDFTEEIKAKFSEWFPVTAWGSKKFKIQFELGDYKINITRVSYNESINNNLRVWTSKLVKDHYKRTADLSKAIRQRSVKRNQAHIVEFELGWEVREAASKMLRESLGNDFIHYQTFIPAGRSFFTTIGRAFMAFDQGRILDPITVQFGRLYSSFQEEMRYYAKSSRPREMDGELNAILGGEIVWEGDRPALSSSDGRTIPFSALSSGQQELLPLVMALTSMSRGPSRKDLRAHLLYIEEPEAHLFPSAQSGLVQGLAALIADPNLSRRLLITTHSPYVLSKINNLIKAGSLERALPEEKASSLSRLVPKRYRIQPNAAKAYAIVDTELKSIIDEDGLIAADYLDSISGEISQEFSKLLDLEFGK